MRVINFNKTKIRRKSTLIMGGFLSLHNGHKLLIDTAKTFKNFIVLMMIKNPIKGDITYSSEFIRLQHAAKLGVDAVIFVDLKTNARQLEGKDFFEKMLKQINVKEIVVGSDFKFGKNKSSTATTLKRIFPSTHVIKPLKINDKKMSSTLLKEVITLGDIDLIKLISPFPYMVEIEVNVNNKIKMRTIVPHSGVYACYVVINEVQYWCNVFININNESFISVKDLRIKNKQWKGVLFFIKKIRTVIKEGDELTKKDISQTIDVLEKEKFVF